MKSKTVVTHRDVFNDIGTSLRTGVIAPPMKSVSLQLPEEALNHTVIPTSPFRLMLPIHCI